MRADWRNYVPAPFKAVLLISTDLELAWAWQYAKTFADPLKEAKKTALVERENVPAILKLCDIYNIPITWVIVGHLFLESCNRINGLAHPEIPRLPHFENEFWKFSERDWFVNDPCSDYIIDPEWYCPDLIKMIISAKIKHEIGCHTFSHIDCRNDICSPEVFDSEIYACKEAARPFGIELKTFVHPAHTIGNLERLNNFGFTSFRTDNKNVLAFPIKHDSGIWEIKNSATLYLRKGWSINYHIYRYKKIIEKAIDSHTVCCLWFHPSFGHEFIEQVMPEFMKYIDLRREEIFISTTYSYIDWLNSNISE
ncbi:MAG: polysaccharide deacetylase family protein [Bacteroidales bacterium]